MDECFEGIDKQTFDGSLEVCLPFRIVNSFPFSMTEAPTIQRILFLNGLIISERRALRASTVKTKRAQEAVALQRTAASSSRMASICVFRMLTT